MPHPPPRSVPARPVGVPARRGGSQGCSFSPPASSNRFGAGRLARYRNNSASAWLFLLTFTFHFPPRSGRGPLGGQYSTSTPRAPSSNALTAILPPPLSSSTHSTSSAPILIRQWNAQNILPRRTRCTTFGYGVLAVFGVGLARSPGAMELRGLARLGTAIRSCCPRLTTPSPDRRLQTRGLVLGSPNPVRVLLTTVVTLRSSTAYDKSRSEAIPCSAVHYTDVPTRPSCWQAGSPCASYGPLPSADQLAASIGFRTRTAGEAVLRLLNGNCCPRTPLSRISGMARSVFLAQKLPRVVALSVPPMGQPARPSPTAHRVCDLARTTRRRRFRPEQ
jgi:hypothetical protein